MSNDTKRIIRYKMYKAKSRWLFTGMGALMVSGALLVGNQITAQADTVAEATPQTETVVPTATDPSAVTPSGTQADSQTAVTTQTNNFNEQNRTYQTVADQYQAQTAQVTTDTANYNSNQTDYEAAVNQYLNDVTTNAPGYQTTSQATKDQLDGEYTAAQNKYDALIAQQTDINDTVIQSNAAIDGAYQSLTNMYDQLPDSVKTAGTLLDAYNDGVSDQAAQLVSASTNDAYQTALQGPTDASSHLATVLDQLPAITATTDDAKITVDPAAVKTVDGSVQATLYGETYTDNNGDGKITYEDDILPVITQDLQSDLSKVQTNQTDLTGSYGEVVALFNYLKQVTDTALPVVTADGETGRIAAKNADIGATLLEQQMAPLLKTFKTAFVTEFLQTIAGTQATVTQQVKTIDDATGAPLDAVTLKAALMQTMLTQATTIYNTQTADLLDSANQSLQVLQQVAATKDPLWQTANTDYKPDQMIADLTTAIATTAQQVEAGKKALANLAVNADAVPVADALALVYSKGDAAAGFPTDLTLQSLQTNLSAVIGKVDKGMSALLTNLRSADPHATTDVAGNTVYSAAFVQTHAALFEAATELAQSITGLVQQSATVTADLPGVLQTLLRVPDALIVTLPVEPELMKTVTPMAPFDLKQVSLMKVNVSVQLNYVDDDNAGALVKTDTQTLQQIDGDTVKWLAQVPANYVLAAHQRDAGTFKVGSSDTVQTVTIHLAHQHAVTKKTQKITTRFVPATADVDALQLPDDDVQTIRWTLDHDLVTGQWTATPAKNRTKMVELPIVQGVQEDDQGGEVFYFVPTVTAIDGVKVSTMTGKTDPTDSIKNVVRTIAYYKTSVAPDNQTTSQESTPSTRHYPVEYVEMNGNQIEVIGEDVFVGHLGDVVEADVPLKYQLAAKVSERQTIDENTGVIVFPVVVFGSEPVA